MFDNVPDSLICSELLKVSGKNKVKARERAPKQKLARKSLWKFPPEASQSPRRGARSRETGADIPPIPIISPRFSEGARSEMKAIKEVVKKAMPVPWKARKRSRDSRSSTKQ